jgi:hypothetical protein
MVVLFRLGDDRRQRRFALVAFCLPMFYVQGCGNDFNFTLKKVYVQLLVAVGT